MDYKIPYKEEWLPVHCGSLPEGVAKGTAMNANKSK